MSIRQTAPRIRDDLRPFLPVFCPLPDPPELARRLWLCTPPGAPTVPVLESTGRDDGPGHLPLLDRPRGLHQTPRQRLENVRAALPDGVARVPGHQKPQVGRARWAIEAAYWRDIYGESEAAVGTRLDLYESWDDERSRGARRYVSDGRRTLAEVGAWPWALDDAGRLERRWWNRERYCEALFVWHERAFIENVNRALLSVDALRVRPEWAHREGWRPARRLYVEWLERQQDAMRRAA